MRPGRLLALALAAHMTHCTTTGSDLARAPAEPALELDRLAVEVWEGLMRRNPIWATHIGDRRYDAMLPDLSEAASDAWRAELDGYVGAIEAIDVAALDTERRVTLEVLRATAARQVDLLSCERDTWDIDQLNGWQVALPGLAVHQPVDTLQAAADFVTRLAAAGPLFDQHIDNLRRGIAAGRTAPRVVVLRVLKQLEAQLAEAPERSPFVMAADRARLSEPERHKLRTDLAAMLRTSIRPALSRYRAFLAETYLPKARTDVAVAAMPNGRECYAALVRYHTGLELVPEEVHRRGEVEVARLHAQMDEVARAAGHKDRRAFMAALLSSPDSYLKSREALLAHNEALVARATAALPRAFGQLPPASVQVVALEAFREADAPAGYYYLGAPDGSRPARYYINTYQPETRPLFNMEALAFHEAVPGHHLQISIAQTLELPEVRRYSTFTTFVEGWALYGELVADELGLYSSPATKLGALNYQVWRAARLVVDTGMHALGWDRARALAYMKDNVALPEMELDNEIDRYIIWPGQALAYMVGRMEIQALRHDAEAKLGSRFDLRRFHDVLLGKGALPMQAARTLIDAWLASELERGVALADPGQIR